jgi:hypothetical protein
VDVVNAPAEFVYNVPCTLAPMFPGEQVRKEQLDIARRMGRTSPPNSRVSTGKITAQRDCTKQPRISFEILGLGALSFFPAVGRFELATGCVTESCSKRRDRGERSQRPYCRWETPGSV